MPLLDRNGWTPDDYVRAETPFGASAVIVPAAALEAALAAKATGQRIGVDLPNDFAVSELQRSQDEIDLIAIAFPGFADGRGFSLARALRGQGYGGRLRASGPLIPDQFAFALECGFDEVEISEEQAARQPVEQWLSALGAIGESYQAVPGAVSIFAKRRAA